LDRIEFAVLQLKDQTTMDMLTLKERLDALSAQTTKVFGEVSGKLAELNTTIDTLTEAVGQLGQTTPEVDAALEAMRVQLAALDALIPDPETIPPVKVL
jgi:hypothetical protein